MMGDSGAWPVLIPSMWNAIADPTGAHAYPALPSRPRHPDAIAYWSPLSHLLLYSFGWRSTNRRDRDRVVMGRGLTELLDSDLYLLPHDSRMAFMKDVWGEAELRDFAEWALRGDDPETAGQIRWRTEAGSVFGGGTDSLHLEPHWSTPIAPMVGPAPASPPSTWADNSADPPTAALLVDTYVGWASVLDEFGSSLPTPLSGRSWRVDVVVRRMGWLGQFRRSRDTGLWFAGGHLLHALAHDS